MHTLPERIHNVNDLWRLAPFRLDCYLGGTLLHLCLHKLVVMSTKCSRKFLGLNEDVVALGMLVAFDDLFLGDLFEALCVSMPLR